MGKKLKFYCFFCITYHLFKFLKNVSVFPGGPCELPFTGDLWHWEQKQPRDQGMSHNLTSFWAQVAVEFHFYLLTLVWFLFIFLFVFSSRQTMRTVTTAMNVSSASQTCGTHWSCRAGICVSAIPAQTPSVIRPTTVLSAGYVRSVVFIA